MVVGQSTVIALMFISSSFILSTNIYRMSVVCKALNEALSVSGNWGAQVSGSVSFKTEFCRCLMLTFNMEGWSFVWILSHKKIHTLHSRNSFDTWTLREKNLRLNVSACFYPWLGCWWPLPVTVYSPGMYVHLLTFFKSEFKFLMILFYFSFYCFVSANEGSLLLPPAPMSSFTSVWISSLV